MNKTKIIKIVLIIVMLFFIIAGLILILRPCPQYYGGTFGEEEKLTNVLIRWYVNKFCPNTIPISFIKKAFAQSFSTDLTNLKNTFPALVAAYEKIKIIDAWERINQEKDSNPLFSFSRVMLGISDTGIDIVHPEFVGVLIDTALSMDIERDGHGTQVAGIIGANNVSATSQYISPQMNGILPGVKDLPYALRIRASGDLANFTLKDSFRQFVELDRLARTPGGLYIINGSFGEPLCSQLRTTQKVFYLATGRSCYSQEEFLAAKDIFYDLVNQYANILFVFGAGNDGIDAQFNLPGGGIISPNIITVGATNLNDDRALFGLPDESNFGSSVSISAPGEKIYAPTPLGKGDFPSDGGDYQKDFSGTSASAPMVTGVAGLLKAINPDLTPAQIKEILITTADPIQTGEPDKRIGTGCYQDPNDPINTGCRLNAYKAVCHPLALNCAPPPTCFLTGSLSVDTTLTPAQSPCIVQNDFTIPRGITLTIEPGVIIKFDSSAYMTVLGSLIAEGSSQDKIYFTSFKDDAVGGDSNGDGNASSPTPGDWGHINIATSSSSPSPSSLKNASVRYGGGKTYRDINAAVVFLNSNVKDIEQAEFSYNKIGVFNAYDSIKIVNSNFHHNETAVYSAPNYHGYGATRTLDLNNNTFSDNSVYGIYVGFEIGSAILSSALNFNNNIFTNNPTTLYVYGGTALSHSNNTATGGNRNGIVIWGSNLFVRTTWQADIIPYIIDEHVYYRNGTLSIEPGAVIKFVSPDSRLIIHANVIFNINGTRDNPVYFTSFKDDAVGGDSNGDGNSTLPAPGDWGYLSYGGGGNFNQGSNINYAKARYGGGITLAGGVSPALALYFSWYYDQPSQNYYLENIEVSNSRDGLYVYVGDWHSIYISNSSFHNNQGYGMFRESNRPVQVNAQNNWWEDATGPYHPSLNPNGLGNAVSDYINFIPFLTVDPFSDLSLE